MTAPDPIAAVLAAPLGPGWTVNALAECVLAAVAARAVGENFALVGADALDRQSRRLVRPLLACLATKSAAESGSPADLYGGRLLFRRPSPAGPVWVAGRFDNRPGSVSLTLWRADARGPNGVPAESNSSRETEPV